MTVDLWSYYGPALAGGALIGTAASVLFWCNGRIAGVSGIAAGLLGSIGDERRWRALFVLGLIAGTGAYVALSGDLPIPRADFSPATLIVAGLLVGYGTALGGGCTSGHGVCGLARGSRRSLLATLVFIAVAMLVTYLTRHLLGGSP
ncbi:MAG: YeeE/YedE family protein [Xanthomonadaceae bacterium]|nr:YeeE/YedE family protein [Xanthomonadaceae bacterium]MDP2186083.1 YeeE/YedE family protein [Xanthomonadales bacterium]MDZ4117478.1 YeeE/YedE family protein [Xanthomonadaceae bacterium]MDZ4379450.1 YeeE/YedE family protein [Xanthomonadaceae bacterium]